MNNIKLTEYYQGAKLDSEGAVCKTVALRALVVTSPWSASLG